jgi:hypothetical protein
MDVVAHTYDIFKEVQLKQIEDRESYKNAKQELKTRLAELNELLNQHLFNATADTSKPYEDWLVSYQPFHWLAEFYQIIHGNGGFDVIIGNPPYIEYNKKDSKTKKSVSDCYKLSKYKTIDCGNLYAFVMERSEMLIHLAAYIGMIVPLSGHSTERMSPLVTHFYKKFSLRLHLNLSADANPQKLFEGVKFRLSIFFVSNAHSGAFATKYTRWYAEERKNLFTSIIRYNDASNYNYKNIIGKIANPLYISIINKVMLQEPFFKGVGNYKCLYHNAPVNWIRSHSFIPFFCSERDGEGITTQLKSICFSSEEKVKVGSSILNSSLFFIWWITNSDCYHLNNPEILNFKYTYDNDQKLLKLSDDLATDMKAKSRRRIYNYVTSGRVEYDEFLHEIVQADYR